MLRRRSDGTTKPLGPSLAAANPTLIWDPLRVTAVGIETAAEKPAIEWFDPVYIAGHWTPQLIELAGGIDVLGMPGEESERSDWDTIRAAQPEIVVCMPCGYDAARSLQEATAFAPQLRGLGARRVVAVDAAGYFSRPGPRLVAGLELLGHVLHPELVELPEGVAGPLEVEL